MIHLVALLLIPLVIAGGSFVLFKNRVDWIEFTMMIVAGVAFAVVGFLLANIGGLSSTEYWNGRVTKKSKTHMSCCHCRTVEYNCRQVPSKSCTGKGSKRSCTTTYTRKCDTKEVCDHSYDLRWDVNISTGDSITIDSCEPPGSRDPAAWVAAKVGDPASVAHSYTNYLKADPESLLHGTADEKMMAKVPPFPRVRDFYKRNPVIHKGGPHWMHWEQMLFDMNADLGRAKQVDVTLLITEESDPSFASAVQAKWLYGPKNSVNIVAHPKDGKFEWVRVVTLSEVEELKVLLRDKLTGHDIQDAVGGVAIIKQIIENHYTRTPMEKFEYLKANAAPSGWRLIMLYILDLILALGLAVWSHQEDIFGGGGRLSFGRRFRRRRW